MSAVPGELDLTRCAIFQGLTSEERQHVLQLVECESYPQGENILLEGLSTHFLWVIVEGRCGVIKQKQHGGEQQLAVLEAWGVFGEMSFFSEAPHSASVRALSPVKVLRLSRQQFDELHHSRPKAAHKLTVNLVSVLADRLRKMDEWTCDFVERPEAAVHKEEWRDFRAKLFADWQF